MNKLISIPFSNKKIKKILEKASLDIPGIKELFYSKPTSLEQTQLIQTLTDLFKSISKRNAPVSCSDENLEPPNKKHISVLSKS